MEYQNRNEANRAQTEQHIKDVFIDMFVEQGLDSISVKALSERAHISKTTFYKYFDDKEPTGTAGIPMLSILDKENITNCLAVVVRYFGGIKLGAGGLLRAYSSAANNVIK